MSEARPSPELLWQPLERIGVTYGGDWFEAARARSYRDAPARALLWRARSGGPLCSDATVRAQLLEEAWVATKVPDGVAQRVLGFGVDPAPWVAYEWLTAVSLRRVFEDGRRASVAASCALGLALADGLAELHGATADGSPLGLRAGSLDAEAVFIDARGRARIENPVARRLTFEAREPVRVGSAEAAWLSPEEATGRPLDVEADVYKVAHVVAACGAGRALFEPSTAAETIAAVRAGDLSAGDLEAWPSALRALLLRALDTDPRKRPPTAGDLSRELRTALRLDGIDASRAELASLAEGLGPAPVGGPGLAGPSATPDGDA